MNDAAKAKAKSSLPEEIRLRREAHKLSQIALADACGLTPQAINRIENGHSPSVKTLEKIATVLGPFEIPCVHDWITDGTPEQTGAVYVMIDGEISKAIWLEDQNVYVLCTGLVSHVDAWREQ